jgi:HSP20 family molecular chaperone IbpA
MILLPAPVREARVWASYDQGVLRVTLPKLHKGERE